MPALQRLPVDSEVPQPAEMLPCCFPLLSGKQYYSSLKSPFMACILSMALLCLLIVIYLLQEIVAYILKNKILHFRK